MEFNCPTCQTKLGVSDDLDNPKVRCRVCGTIFRPFELGATPADPQHQVSPTASPVNPFHVEPKPTASPSSIEVNPPLDRQNFPAASTVPTSRPLRPRPARQKSGRGGWVIAAFIIFMVLSRVPRMFRNFEREEPQPQPAPFVIDHDEMRRNIRELGERNEQNKVLEDWQRQFDEQELLPNGAENLILEKEAP